ncbi:MAG: hypothetical protein NUV77_25220, partial [Thermoguttaceae bacterium]|nr:hypothetical protein [Thermoguttaceae bacterium]
AGQRTQLQDMSAYVAAVPYRLLVVALVAAADVAMGWRWLDEPGRLARRRARARATAGTQEDAAGASGRTATMLGRLVWQHACQSSRLILAFGVMLVPLLVFLVVGLTGRGRPFGALERMPVFDVVIVLLAMTAYLAAPLLGASVFLADQSASSFRFLADRGVRPRLVWLSRHLVWMSVAAVGLAAVLPLLIATAPSQETATAALIVAGFVLLAYSCGQLCSMYFQSGILAAVAGIVLTFCLAAWAGFMNWLKMSWLWSVAPLPIAFLFATWLRAPDWLTERTAWRSRLRAIAPVVVPMGAILAAVPVVRVHEIPWVDLGFDPAEFARPLTPEEAATMALYRQASDQVLAFLRKEAEKQSGGGGAPGQPPAEEPPRDDERGADRLSPFEKRLLANNQEALRLTLEASRREAANFFVDPAYLRREVDGPLLADLVVISAKQLELEGKLDEALDRYLATLRISAHMRVRAHWPADADRVEQRVYDRLTIWATRPGQTAKRVAEALRRVRRITANLPSRCDAIKWHHLYAEQMLEAKLDLLKAARLDENTMSLLRLVRCYMPWERARAVRLLNRMTADNLAACLAAEQRAAAGQKVIEDDQREPSPMWQQWQREWPFVADVVFMDGRQIVRDMATMETHRRATQLLLALHAWRLEHNELPEKLDALVGPYFDKIPADPFTGEPFRYFPKGVPVPLEWSEWRFPEKRTLAPGTPFLWSAGMKVKLILFTPQGAGLGRYQVQSNERPGWRTATADQDVLQSGWVFPIPDSGTNR